MTTITTTDGLTTCSTRNAAEGVRGDHDGGALVFFVIMAMRDAYFFVRTAQTLRSRRHEVKFISFYQAANEYIESSGFECYDVYTHVRSPPQSTGTVADYEKRYGIANLHALILHEKLTSGNFDDASLERKFIAYLDGADKILAEASKETNGGGALVVQELGGFIGPLSVYFASRRRGMRHVFLEPSFFRKRLHFVTNGLQATDCSQAPTVAEPCNAGEIARYLEDIRTTRSLVIPSKDRHHFRDMRLGKVVNRTNLEKLRQKLVNKYVRGHRHEFDFIFGYSVGHLRMYCNRQMNALLYSSFDESCKSARYVYFPLHVRLDFALTIRSPEFLNQLGLIEVLCQALPAGVGLYVKEHPASIGGFSFREMRGLLKKFPRLRLIHPATNTHDLAERAELIVTINSKAGAEALIQGKKVIVLGDAFYAHSPLVTYVGDIRSLGQAIAGALREEPAPLAEVERFFRQVWSHTRPGELYDLSEDNIRGFAEAVHGATQG